MKIITNDKLIKRNSRIGRIASYIGLAVMAGSMYVTFRYPEWIAIAYLLLFGGLALSQIGLYYGNRWGRRPRPDEQIDQALKGLDDRFAMYHYTTPTRHLLVRSSRCMGSDALLSNRQSSVRKWSLETKRRRFLGRV